MELLRQGLNVRWVRGILGRMEQEDLQWHHGRNNKQHLQPGCEGAVCSGWAARTLINPEHLEHQITDRLHAAQGTMRDFSIKASRNPSNMWTLDNRCCSFCCLFALFRQCKGWIRSVTVRLPSGGRLRLLHSCTHATDDGASFVTLRCASEVYTRNPIFFPSYKCSF